MPTDQSNISRYAPGFKIAINGAELEPEAAFSIVSLKVEQELNKTNAFSFEVQEEFKAGHFRWLETKLFCVANPVSLSLGYTNNLVKILEGKIQNLNASFHSGCAPSFTVEGTDNAYDQLTKPSDTQVFKEKRDSDIVRKIADEVAHLDAEVDETELVATVKTKQGGKSYLDFLRGLAADNDYEFFLGGRRLCFKEDAYKDSTATLTWGQNLIRFEPLLNTSASVSKVIVRGWDSKDKKMIEGQASAGDEQTHESEKSTASELTKSFFGDVVKVITNRPVRSVDEANRLALAELNRISDQFIQATVETVGIPELTPGTCIDIEGFGTLFSGKYYVVKATHSITGQGYRTLLNVRRNAA